jgi:hypothetical protein
VQGAEERGMGASCGAPTLEKATAAREGERRTSGAMDAPVAVACVQRRGKEMSLFFRETVNHLMWSGADMLAPMAA